MNIIQTWKDKHIPFQYSKCIESLRTYCKNCNFLFFTDENIDTFINTIVPEYKDTYDKLPHKIQRIDFFRYLAVYYYGGIYLDLDILLEQPLDDLIKEPKVCKFPIEYENIEDFAIKKQGFSELIGQYAFYAPAGHPFLKKIIDNIVSQRFTKEEIDKACLTNGDKPEEVNIYYTTGPILVTQSYLDMEDKENIELIKPDPFKNERFGEYAIHFCAGSWRTT